MKKKTVEEKVTMTKKKAEKTKKKFIGRSKEFSKCESCGKTTNTDVKIVNGKKILLVCSSCEASGKPEPTGEMIRFD